MKITFIGGGNMASALIGGLLARKFAATDIRAIEVLSDARARLNSQFGVNCAERMDHPPASDEIVVFAVKPQQMKQAAQSSALAPDKNLVISIAAGITLKSLSHWLGGHEKLVRAMPNTPALIGAGVTGLYALGGVNAAEKKQAESILAAVGRTVWIREEAQMDVVTAVSGSGPAYVFWLIEQLAAIAEARGLGKETAKTLAMETVLGSAKLAAQSTEPPAVLRERVTSKGGTTEAALKVFEEEKLAERFKRAIEAATKRGAELGEMLGKD